MSRSRSRSAARSEGRRAPVSGSGFTVWVGGLPDDCREDEIHDKFGKFGKIIDVRLKVGSGRGPPFAFVEYKDKPDADDCVREMDQQQLFGSGNKIAVQHSGPPGKGKGRGRNDSRGGRVRSRRYDSRGRRGRYDSRDRGRGGHGRGGYGDRPKDKGEGNFKITLEGLPADMTWTELKELGKQHVDNRPSEVTFARTFRNRSNLACGILEFRSKHVAEDVVSRLNGRKIKGHEERLEVKMGDMSRGNY